MTITSKISIALVGVISLSGAAFAQEAQLTDAEFATVTEACSVGLPLIPVSSDYGYDTGEYALPISQTDGEVHSALIVSAAALRDIPECKAEIEAMTAENDDSGNRIS